MEHSDTVDLFIFQKWKRLFFANKRGEKQRLNIRFKFQANILLLALVKLGKSGDAHAASVDLRHDARVSLVLTFEQLFCACENSAKLFLRGHARLIIARAVKNEHGVMQTTNTYHEKFIEIALKDRDEIEPFEQGHAFVLSFFEHAFVKFEPRKLSIDVTNVFIGVFWHIISS